MNPDMNRKIFSAALSALLWVVCSTVAGARNLPQIENQIETGRKAEIVTDSTVIAHKVDSIFLGQNILEHMPSRFHGDSGSVIVRQSHAVREAMSRQMDANKLGMAHGYRIRIFFSNAKNARTASDEAVAKFREKSFLPIYCTYVSPYFKVTVGNFMSRSEAMEELRKIRVSFPGAFLVKEDVYNTY